MHSRYLAATIMDGKVYVQGLPAYGEWDERRVVWWPEEAVKIVVQPLAGDRMIHTEGELQEMMQVLPAIAPATRAWLHGDLEQVVRRIWEEQRTR